ncbi:hypothetical protein CON65_12630 [Bacillus pseudomycoides]|uniref:Uncharacterized protein n=1 Tax=Bacillus pseudomycoides TaxID=64104 RepID=A0AA91VCY4_9BACI|nr:MULTISPECIES: hypothetical protein [Bacillus]PED82323.1 hypothetical protein CON65_12630 [Bacillus pseudomycoides]PFW63033.1 hypothetical protein COL20_10455 [Bacillus sp. AFS075034]
MDNKNLNSTWRENPYTVNANSYLEVTFDGNPNYFHVNNLSSAILYFGVNMIPSKQKYDMSIASHGENIHARDLGTKRIMIFNDSPDKANIILTSGEHKFDPTVLANRSSSGGGGSGGTGGGAAGGVITGFAESLPSGDNHIGKVTVTEMPPISMQLNELPAGGNLIGQVEVTKLPPLASPGGKIGDVEIVGGVSITSMPAVELQVGADMNVKEKSYDDFFYQEPNVAQTEISYSTNLARILYITNDGVTPVKVTINTRVITLQPNEVLNDLPIVTKSIKFVRTTGTGVVRVMGV